MLNNGIGWNNSNRSFYNDRGIDCGTFTMSNQYLKELMNKDMEISALHSEKYSDQNDIETYKQMVSMLRAHEADASNRFEAITKQLCEQAVINQANKDSVLMLKERIGDVRRDLHDEIDREACARRSADNSIVNYVNATFYPKRVADVTTGDTTTPQPTYNPLPIEL